MIKYIIGWLLHISNTNLAYKFKKDFYKLKDKLVKKFGKKIGTDIQHIKEICYQCNGTGIFESNWKPPEPCWYCFNGYHEYWTVLDKYKISKWTFHNPVEKLYIEPKTKNNIIEGYITHRGKKYKLAMKSFIVLTILFDKKMLWNLILKQYVKSKFEKIINRNDALPF